MIRLFGTKFSISVFGLIATATFPTIDLGIMQSAIASSQNNRWLIAQKNHLDRLVIAVGFDLSAAMVTGHTGGSYSLASITNQDKNGNHCMGYSDPEPDHIMILEDDFAELSLKVNSGGQDTTLVIKGPNSNDIRCAFGKKQMRDALIKDTNWQRGQYEIWVGSMQPKQRSTYRLSVQ